MRVKVGLGCETFLFFGVYDYLSARRAGRIGVAVLKSAGEVELTRELLSCCERLGPRGGGRGEHGGDFWRTALKGSRIESWCDLGAF